MDKVKPPTGLSAFFWRLPIWLFRLKLDFLLGNRILLLKHIGRKSGEERQAALEVVRYDKENDSYYLCSGFGTKSQWYQNLKANPDVWIRVAGRDLAVHANLLSPKESGEAMRRYAENKPKLAQGLMRVVGHEVPHDLDGFQKLGEAHLPFVALIPR